jgi:quercetin dioxygenase-like cupin family protein
MKALLIAAVVSLAGTALAADAPPKPATVGKTYHSTGGSVLRPLTDPKTYGGTEVDVGELTFPPNSDSGDHVHGAVETFFVLEGELEHVVNGKSQILKPGMLGTVRPPDKVRHKTGPAGAKAIVVWAPGGEMARIASRWKEQ